MSDNPNDPKNLMEEGWKARENLEFDKAENLLTQARNIFEESGDFHDVTECLNHLAYLYQMKAVQEAVKSIKAAEASLKLAAEKSLNKSFSNRAMATVLKSAGAYERAESYAREFLASQITSGASRSDARVSLAQILMRRGKLEEANKELLTATEELEEGWNQERMPHKMIWKTKLLLTKALLNYNLDKLDEAKILALEAKTLAAENDLKQRLQEAEEILKLFP